MEAIPCLGCSHFFIPRNKNQEYCSKPECQKARKARWQREKLQKDPDYRESQRLSNQKWLANNPDYFRKYRDANPEKAMRNRLLQRVRNRKNLSGEHPCNFRLIAKMDAGKASSFRSECGFWLVPTIAKMDARKFYLHLIPESWP